MENYPEFLSRERTIFFLDRLGRKIDSGGQMTENNNSNNPQMIRPTSHSLQSCKGKITELFARWMSSAQGELVVQTLIRETLSASRSPHSNTGNGNGNQSLQQHQLSSEDGGGGASPPVSSLEGGANALKFGGFNNNNNHNQMFDLHGNVIPGGGDGVVGAAERRPGGSNTPQLTGASKGFFGGVDEVEMMRAHSPGASSPVSPNAAAALRAGGGLHHLHGGGHHHLPAAHHAASGKGGGVSGGDMDPSLPRAIPSSPELSRSPQPAGGGAGGPPQGSRFIDPMPLPMSAQLENSMSSNRSGLHNSPSNARTREFLQQQQLQQSSSNLSNASGLGSSSHLGKASAQQQQLQQQQQQRSASYREIPRFYFPKGLPSSSSAANSDSDSNDGGGGDQAMIAQDPNEAYRRLTSFFAPPGSRATATSIDVAHRGLKRANIGQLCVEVFGLPAWMRGVVFKKMLAISQLPDNGPATVIRLAEAKRLLDLLQPLSVNKRLFECIRGSGTDTGTSGHGGRRHTGLNNNNNPYANCISFDDLTTLVRSVVDFHQGLEFLTQDEFQNAYCKTVAYRILFRHDPHGTRHVSWANFNKCGRSRLPEVLQTLDSVADINQVLEYFSYEHFYVLYCRFWELDTDKDLHINLEDLKEYNSGTICTRALERVIQGKGRRLTSTRPGYMTFEDFVYFCLAEEDKLSDAARVYWFNVVDVDGDGVISGFELAHFFEEQKQRLIEAMGPDQPLKVEDLFCQTMDMVAPQLRRKDGLRLEEIRNTDGPVDVFFNLFINTFKFLNFENRDPFEEFRSRQGAERTQWDRFARAEYDRLAQEAMSQQ